MDTEKIKLSNVIGAPFSEFVLRQLAIRAGRSSTGAVSQFGIRTGEEVLYLANKTAWARLVSSVDLELPPDSSHATKAQMSKVAEALGVAGSGVFDTVDSFAKNWILEAGTSVQNGNGIDLRRGIGPNGAYGLGGTEELGYRPMPGLTSISVETAGRLGSLRTATVNFQVWNMNQLNMIEALYFRLGYSMLLEWGHTQYFQNYGEDLKSKDGGVFVSKGVYGIGDPFVANLRKEVIQEAIAKKRYETSGNYDGMFGLVVNFNWSYNQDGGYDCSVKLVGMGAIIDSVKINQVYTLPPGVQKRFKIAADFLNAFINNKIVQGIKDGLAKAGGPGGPVVAGIDPKPTNQDQLKQREQAYDDFPTDATDLEFVTTYGAKSARNLALQSNGALNPNNYYDYYSTFAGTGRSAGEVRAAQQEYGNGLFLASRPGGFIFVRPNSPVTLDVNLLDIFFSRVTVPDWGVEGRPPQVAPNKVSYVVEQSLFPSIFDYQTGRYTRNIITGGGVGGASTTAEPVFVGQDAGLIDAKQNAAFTERVDVSFGGQKGEVTFGAGWEAPARDGDFNATRREFVTAIKEWYTNSKQARITDIVYTKGKNQTATITGTFTVALKVFYNNPKVPLDAKVIDKSTGNTVTVRDRIKALPGGGIQEEGDRLYKTVPVDINFSTNNPGFILGAGTPPPTTTANTNTTGNVNPGPDPAIQQVATDNQINSSMGFESALHAMLTTVQTTAQAESEKSSSTTKLYKSKKEVKVAVVDVTGITAEFYKGNALDGVFDVKNKNPAISPSTFDLVKYAAKGFSSELMTQPDKFDKIDYVGGTKIQPGFENLCKAVVVKYLQKNPLTDLQFPGQFQVYIPLGYLLAFLNNMCLFYDSKVGTVDASAASTTGDGKRPYVYIDFNPETNFCLTAPQQFSIDPNVCLVPANLTPDEYLGLFPEGLKPSSPFNPQKESTVTQAIDDAKLSFKSIDSTYRGKTMNILVCTQYLLSTLRNFATGDREHAVALQPFLDRVMSDINKTLGNINLFRIAYRDDTNTVQIQDDQYVPPLQGEATALNRVKFLEDLKKNAVEAGEIPLFASEIIGSNGQKFAIPSLGIARDMQLKTVMSTRMASKLAISAQANTGSVNSSDHSELSWLNRNYRDRYKPFVQDASRVSGKPPTTGTNTKKQDPSKSNDQEAADKFNEHVKTVYSSLALSEDAIEPSKNYYIERMSKVKSSDVIASAAPPIPLEIEITMDGIGGIIMGNAFVIPRQRLPKTYIGEDGYPKVGFIVNGLTHKIENNEWTTTLKGQMIKLRGESGLGTTFATATGNQSGLLDFTNGDSSGNRDAILANIGGPCERVYEDKIKSAMKNLPGFEQLKKALSNNGYQKKEALSAILAIAGGESGWEGKEESYRYSDAQIAKYFGGLTDDQRKKVSEARDRGDAKEVFNILYGDRATSLGNTAREDGYNYRGRGYVKLTGRANYQAIGGDLNLDLINNPDLVGGTTDTSARVVVAYYNRRLKGNGVQINDPNFMQKALQATGNSTSEGVLERKIGYYNCLVTLI